MAFLGGRSVDASAREEVPLEWLVSALGKDWVRR